jgi:hypothetical protein
MTPSEFSQSQQSNMILSGQSLSQASNLNTFNGVASIAEYLSPEQIDTAFASGNRNEGVKLVAELIDQQIIANYRLFPYNYIAHDLLNASSQFSSNYSEKDVSAFETYMQTELQPLKGEPELLRNQLLKMYANPINRKQELNCL